VKLLPVAEAQARLLALARPVDATDMPIGAAAGLWASEDVVAKRDQPSADLSAMDGYAIAFSSMPGPWTVIGESAAGRAFSGTLAGTEAARIFTGAPLPGGSDTILIQEDATRDGTQLSLRGDGPARQGQHVRKARSDFASGDLLIAQGAVLTPARIAVAAIGGHGNLRVRRPLRVTIIATGDELVPPGAPLAEAQIPASNTVMLAALLRDLPVAIEDGGIVPDRIDALQAAFRAAADADIIVTTGGASVGDHDLVHPALESLGASLDFWRVAMKPGKPLMAGTLGTGIVLGLPGNPVSAFVTATLFLRPLVRALSGASEPLPSTHRATLAHAIPAGGDRAEYLRAHWEGGTVHLASSQDSAALAALASANALIVRSPGAPAAPAGESVEVISLA